MERIRDLLKEIEFGWLPDAIRVRLVPRVTPNPWHRAPTIHDGRTLVFIHVPKTAGTSLSASLDLPIGHVPLSRYRAWDPEAFEAAWKVAFVRSPWTRMVSAFGYLHSAIGVNTSPDVRWATATLGNIPDFPTFIRRLERPRFRRHVMAYKHFRPQRDWIALPGSANHALDRMYRFEQLEQDAAEIAASLGRPFTLPHRRAPRSRTNIVWTAELVQRVAELYRDDIRLLAYAPPTPA